MTGELDEIAAELCSGPLAEFVSSRSERAARAGDPELAKQIRALRKPTVAAWAVNVFARNRGDQLGEALRLAGELREAQEQLDAGALTELGRQRRALTRRLAQEAAQLAASQGERITEATVESVHQTLSAAFFDPQAAAAVASGRLVRTLDPDVGAIGDLDGVVAGSAPATPTVRETPTDELAERRRLRAAEADLREAEKARERAERAAADASSRVQRTQERVESLAERVSRLEDELARTRAALQSAHEEVEQALGQRSARAEDARIAQEREAAARDALERLRS